MSSLGNLYTVSAPSGAGKTSLVTGLLQKDSHLCVSISHTTRPRRKGEKNGQDYHFVDEATFQTFVEARQMLEHARVFGHLYGTSKTWVENTLRQGFDVILEIDWQGRNQVLEQLPNTIAITILPPSKQVLAQRLNDRGTDSADVIAKRMAEANQEIQECNNSHYLIINNDYDRALADLGTIFTAQRLKTSLQRQKYHQLLTDLLSPNA